MKLNDIIPITKTKYTIGLSKNQFYKGKKVVFDEKGEEYLWFSQADLKFIEENGYLARGISAHSKDKGWLRNNYEKDIVIAYIDTPFVKIFLLKNRKDYKIFSYTNTSETEAVLSYDWYRIDKEDILEKYKNLLKIVDKEEYSKYIKSRILRGLENERTK